MKINLGEKAFAVIKKPQNPKGTVIIIPGGGFLQCSKIEKDPIAEAIVKHGYQAIIFEYQTPATHYPKPLIQLEELVDSKEIIQPLVLLGFSAGGHILVNFLNHTEELEKIQSVGLGYPLLDMVKTFETLPDFSEIMFNSALVENNHENRVNYSTYDYSKLSRVPHFIFHCLDDSMIAPQQSIEYAQQLTKHQGDCTLFLTSEGKHGKGLGLEYKFYSRWFNHFINFIEIKEK